LHNNIHHFFRSCLPEHHHRKSENYAQSDWHTGLPGTPAQEEEMPDE
jgi:hypothetical protein